MELQELVPKGVTSQLRYAVVSPRFVDQRGALIESLVKPDELTEWRYGENSLEVFSRDQKVAFHVGSRDLRATFEHFDDPGAAEVASMEFFGDTLDKLGVSKINFVGVRSYWLAPADSFEDLAAWLVESLGSGLHPLFDVFGSKPTDAGWVFEFHAEDPKYTVRLGPMTPAQAVTQVFRDSNEENFPPQFLFLDVDRVYTADIFDRDTALERWSRSFKRTFEIGEKLAEVLVAP